MDFLHQFDFVSKFLIATPSLHVPTSNQVVSSPPKPATQSGTINNYDMGWRIALRAICPATTVTASFHIWTIRMMLPPAFAPLLAEDRAGRCPSYFLTPHALSLICFQHPLPFPPH
ncbi:hypothetical protein TNCV_3355321 [Trichonephila clavipes]|nr:hypothetical protein TNCV_3355321 [Trichonephila clavipes]